MNQSKDIFNEIGSLFVTDKSDILDLLEGSGIELTDSDKIDDLRLIDLYVDNLPSSDQLKYGTAYLIQLKSNSSFDGVVDNESVYATYDTIYDYWTKDLEEPNSNVVGALIRGASDLTNTALQGRQKRQQAKDNILQAMIEQKRREQQQALKDKEQKSQQQKTLIYGGIGLLGIVVLTGLFYAVKKSQN